MKRTEGHTALGRFTAFVHDCPGEGCAIERWILTKATHTEWVQRYHDPHPPKPMPELVTHPIETPPIARVEIGKTWPELVADLIGKEGETC